MELTVDLVLLIVALVCFGLAAINVVAGRQLDLVAGGLFFWVLSVIWPG